MWYCPWRCGVGGGSVPKPNPSPPSISVRFTPERTEVLMKAVTGNLSVVWGSYCRKNWHEEKFIRGARSVFI